MHEYHSPVAVFSYDGVRLLAYIHVDNHCLHVSITHNTSLSLTCTHPTTGATALVPCSVETLRWSPQAVQLFLLPSVNEDQAIELLSYRSASVPPANLIAMRRVGAEIV